MPDEIQVQDREELIYLLCEAAEFEHSVMCTYLYAMWSLKRDLNEGVTGAELEAIGRWRSSLRRVVLEEMLHLSLVNNMLAAVGASAHLWRPEFPVPPGVFPADIVMKLAPLTEATLEHFMFIERPEGIDIPDGAGFDHEARYRRVLRADLLAPAPQDYDSQGHLYHGLIRGLARLARELGEENLFVGHGEAQLSAAEFGLPGLFTITDLQSARRAVESIVLQGEGAPAHRQDSHYARFAAIRDEMARLREARPDFAAARPAAESPTIYTPRACGIVCSITDPLAAQVVDLGNSVYALTMRTFAQLFAPAPLLPDLRTELAAAAEDLMRVLGEIGEAATRLPVGAEQPGTTAGVNFALPVSSGQLVSRCAAQILGERTAELARAARKLQARARLDGVAQRLDELAHRFADMHARFGNRLAASAGPAGDAAPEYAPSPPPAEAGLTPPAHDDFNVAQTKGITLRFDGSRCIHARNCVLGAPRVFLANMQGAWLHPEAASVEQCVHIAHNCPSGAITYQRHDGGPPEVPPQVNVIRVRENGPYAVHASIELRGHGSLLRATLCRCGRSAMKPFCDGSHREAGFVATGEPETASNDRPGKRGGRLVITPLADGPLQITGDAEICTGTGRTVACSQKARLCRCGASGTKPFCDGSHARVHFQAGN